MQSVFFERARPYLTPGARILDVGGGRAPTIARVDRPSGAYYVGLDISASELAAAAGDAYDETISHDITRPLAVEEPFDLILSWQALEHVAPLDAAFESLRAVLKPGGTLVAQTSGGYAAFSLLGRLLPHRLRSVAMERLIGHPAEAKFPTRYDRCTARNIEQMLADWSSHEIIPYYRGATYFAFARPLQRVYLLYESAVARRRSRELATHYLIVATR